MKFSYVAIIAVIFLTSCSKEEVYSDPNGKFGVYFSRKPLSNPEILLINSEGRILASKEVGNHVRSDEIEFHMTDNGLVVLPGDSDWLWENTLWIEND